MIHWRESTQEGLDLLVQSGVNPLTPIHVHCHCDPNYELCINIMQLFPNLKFGFTNVLTFYNASDLRGLVKKIPMNKILLESDSPYFSIHGNPYATPADIKYLADAVAKLKDMNTIDVLNENIKNSKAVYPLFWINK